MSLQIHWHEGLFLQPQHLQRLQRHGLELVRRERRLAWDYPYGVVEARLSPDELENRRVRLLRLRAVLPSGVEVDYPDSADLPSLDVKGALAAAGGGGITVSLGVPLWFEDRANVVGNHSPAAGGGGPAAKLLYQVAERELADENTGENRQPVQIRRVNARLLLDGDDRADLEVLPLLRIAPAGAGEEAEAPRVDPQFAPPCLVLAGSPALREMARDLASQVEAARREIAVRAARGGFEWVNLRGAQLEQLFRLRTLNRFAARLGPLVEAPATAPFTLWLTWRELLGELLALHPDHDEDFETPPYDHDRPYLPFAELARKIRVYLRGLSAATFLKVPFVDAAGLLTAELTDEHLTRPNDYFLGVQTREDPRALARLVENADRFKLMPRSLASRAIRGIALKEERFPPMELPAQTGLFYFRLLRPDSPRSWQQITQDKAAVVRWTGADIEPQPGAIGNDFRVTLYMTLPDGGGGGGA